MRLAILAFALGVWLLQCLPALPGPAWLLVLLPLVAAIQKLNSVSWRRVLVLTFMGFTGFAWAALFAHWRLSDALPTQWEGRDVEVIGVVASMPTIGEHGVRFRFDVEQVLSNGAEAPRHILLNWYLRNRDELARTSPVHAGERWQWTVRLKRPHGSANPHGFDYEAWLLEQNVRATGYVRESSLAKRLTQTVIAPGYLIERARESIRAHMQSVLQQQRYGAVLVALAIGDQSAIAPADWDLFWQTGIGHLISISGLHVTMISGLMFAVAYFLWRRSPRLTLGWPAHKAASVAGVAAALGYAVLAGLSIPTQRTLMMVAVFAVALWRDRLTSPTQVLCTALLLVLLYDPWAVNSAGFWLSFAAVGLIFYVMVGRSRIIGNGIVAKLSMRLINATRMQWAITIGLVPLLLGLFQQVSLISPLANAIAIPLISLVVVPLTLIGTVPGLEQMLQLAHQALAVGMHGLEAARDVPFGQWSSAAPTGWAMATGIAGVLWLLLPRGFPARWLGWVGLLPLFVVAAPRPNNDAFWVTTLDVGQGLAMVVQTAHHTLLYDTGPRFTSETDSGNRVVVPYLRATGVQHLDGMIVSHDDADHSGGALSVLRAVPIDWIMASLPKDHPLEQAARKFIPCSGGQSWQWDGVGFEVLHPGPFINVAATRDNDRGCVLKISSRFGSMLLPADIEATSEQQLVQSHTTSLPSTVMISPHHGSKTSSSADFLAAVQPKFVVVSAGYRNRFGHPKEEILQRYEAAGAALYRSDRDGAVTFRFDGQGVRAEAYREIARRYWYGQ
ncbi:MAG: DNA internalization-related competence protein ComEC/Rec2 [Burkholderiales bacterium]